MTVRVEREDGRPVCERCTVADSPRARLRGLLGRRVLPAGDGLLLRPCASVHTCFLRFPIDVIFLDADDLVVRVVQHLRPWRTAGRRGAKAALELAACEARHRGIETGERLTLLLSNPSEYGLAV